MMMAEAERRPGKTLVKQPEIEELEEEYSAPDKQLSANGNSSPNLDPVALEDSANIDDQDVSSIPSANGSFGNSSDENRSPCPFPAQSSPQLQQNHESSCEDVMIIDDTRISHIPVTSKSKPLMRGTAICDGASPPPNVPEVKVITTPATDNDDDSLCECSQSPALLGQSQAGAALGRTQFQKNGSQSSDAGTCSSLSRESSVEKNAYKDSTGVDLLEFIKKTLYKSAKDRKMLLQLERDFKRFVADPKDQFLQLSEMCSYDRMLVHRVAAFYGMDHNINQTGKSVIVSKTKFTRVPDFNCEEYLQKNPDMEPKKKILLKKPHSFEEKGSRSGDKSQFGGHRAKSLEERQKSYDEKRKQIFGNTCQDDTPAFSVIESGTSKSSLSSKEWSSTESSGYGTEDGLHRGTRNFFTKSNSYGGKPAIHLTPANPRTCSLSKADLAWADSIQTGSYESSPVRPNKLLAMSPENSDQSPLSRCSSADVSHSPGQGYGAGGGSGLPYTVLVATDVSTIPPGSMLVNPVTMQPHINPDGTIYRFNPSEPPPWLAMSVSTPTQQSSSCGLNYSSSVQYQDGSELCNRFSGITVGGLMEGTLEGQQLYPVHHQQQQQQPLHQHNSQQPFTVSSSLSQPVSQSQQFATSHAQFISVAAPYYSNPQVLTGPPVRYVSYVTSTPGQPVDQQGQPLSFSGPGHSSMGSGMVNYSVQPQTQSYTGMFVPGGSTIQSGISEQGNMGPSVAYGQTVFSGQIGESSASGNTFSIPYVPASGVYTYTTYNPSVAGSGSGGQVAPPVVYYGGPAQSSSPQLTFAGFAPGPTAQTTLRPATPPSQMNHAHGVTLNIAQPVGYHNQQGVGGGSVGHTSHSVSSPPQFTQHPGTVYATAHPFPGQVRPVGQMVQIPMCPPTSLAGPTPVHTQQLSHLHQIHHQHHSIPPLQHSQSFPVVRTGPGGGASTLSLTSTLNGNPTTPQSIGTTQYTQHPMMTTKSMSVNCMRPRVGASTPDKDSIGMGIGGMATFVPNLNQVTGFQIPAQLVPQTFRPAQPGELRMVGTTGLRPQFPPFHVSFTPGQPVKPRASTQRQARASKRLTRNSGSIDIQTSASSSVSTVIASDLSTVQTITNRQ